MTIKKLYLLLLGLVLSACTTTPETGYVTIDSELVLDAQNASTQHKVSKEYDSYTFLLITSADWAASTSKLDLQRLRDSIEGFGAKIGNKNLAVIFFDKDKSTPDTVTAARFAKLFNLDLSRGPYLVYLTPRHPRTLNLVIESIGGKRNKLVPMEIFYPLLKEDFEKGGSIIVDLNGVTLNCTKSLLNNIQANLYWRQNPESDIRTWQSYDNCDTSTAAQKILAWLLDVVCITAEKTKSLEVGVGRTGVKVHWNSRSRAEARVSCQSNRKSSNAR